METPTSHDTLSLHFTGTVNKIFEHEQKLAILAEQIAQVAGMCRETRGDIKGLLAYAERHAERDAIYDRILRVVPISIGLVSAVYWILSHLKNN